MDDERLAGVPSLPREMPIQVRSRGNPQELEWSFQGATCGVETLRAGVLESWGFATFCF